MRVGVLMTDGIGDVICASGMIADLRRAWPSSFICAVTRSDAVRPLFRGRSRVDAFVRYDPVEGNTPARVWSLVRALRQQRLDIFVVATDIDARKAPWLAFASGARVRVGEAASAFARLYTRSVPRNASQHKVLSNRDIVRLLGIEASSPPRVEVAGEDIDHGVQLLRSTGLAESTSIVAVHPGSSEALKHKRWPTALFVELLTAIAARGVQPVLVGAGPDIPLCDELSERLGPRVLSVAGRLTLSQTAGLLKHSIAALGGDSGIMHLAAAVGTPVVALFGPTDEARSRPFDARRVLTAGLPCQPCFDHLPFGCGVPACMTAITSARVEAAVVEILAATTVPSRSQHTSMIDVN
jgi:ADP-heptose:LPS heptosyltransferase